MQQEANETATWQEIENLDSLTNLRELWLGKNKITELKVRTPSFPPRDDPPRSANPHAPPPPQNLEKLHNLTILSLPSNRLTSPTLAHLSLLPQLREFYASHNALTSLAPLAAAAGLRTLDISSNPVASLAGLAPLRDLEELWASDCALEDWGELERELGGAGALRTVYFEGNSLERRGRAVYRGKVRMRLPQVRQIDASELFLCIFFSLFLQLDVLFEGLWNV